MLLDFSLYEAKWKTSLGVQPVGLAAKAEAADLPVDWSVSRLVRACSQKAWRSY
jgi:hypothetical protein